MQEQNGTPAARGGLRLILGIIIAIALLWLFLWLLFFRGMSSRPSGSHTISTKPKQSTDGTTGQSGANSNGSTNTESTQLANAGAGNILTPTLIAGVVGGTLYQIRLRKKLSS